MLKNFARNVFKWHYFDQVYSRFTRDGKIAFFTSQTRPLRRQTSQRRQPEVFLAVISLPLAVTDICPRRILSRLISQRTREKLSAHLNVTAKSILKKANKGKLQSLLTKSTSPQLLRSQDLDLELSRFRRSGIGSVTR